MKHDWGAEKDRMHNLINVQNLSYVDIGKMYGITSAGVRKIAARLGIELPKRKKTLIDSECFHCKKTIKGNRKYCSHVCQMESQYKQYIDKWINQNDCKASVNHKVSNHIRRYLFSINEGKCSLCGWSQVNPYTGAIPLEVDHVDGNYQNNKKDNLLLLCPNCHSLTSTFKGANRGNGRKHRVSRYQFDSDKSL